MMVSIANYKITSYICLQRIKREEAEEASLVRYSCSIWYFWYLILEILYADSSSHPEALPFVDIDEPTLSMNFMVNNSPFAGQEGNFVTIKTFKR